MRTRRPAIGTLLSSTNDLRPHFRGESGGLTFAMRSAGAGFPALVEVRSMRFWPLVLLALALGTPALAEAQSQSQPPSPSPDFLFGGPRGSIGISTGWVVGRGGSDWYNFVTDQ